MGELLKLDPSNENEELREGIQPEGTVCAQVSLRNIKKAAGRREGRHEIGSCGGWGACGPE